MTSAPKVSSAISSRYARALIDVATDENVLDKVEADLQDLQAMIQGHEDLALLIRTPSTKKSDQTSVLCALCKDANVQEITGKFLGVLVENKRLYAVESVIEAVQKELAKQRGEVSIEITTAQDLSAGQLKSLEDALKVSVGAKVAIKAKVEPGILGGIIVTVGSHMIDDSVARKLERLRTAMTKQANQNTDQQTQKEVV